MCIKNLPRHIRKYTRVISGNARTKLRNKIHYTRILGEDEMDASWENLIVFFLFED